MFGKGTKLHRKEGAAWYELGKVVNVTPPVLTREAIDISYLNDPSLYKDYIPGVHEGGDMTVELHLIDPATSADGASDTVNHHDAIFADHRDGVKSTYCLEFPSKDGVVATGKWKFTCIVTSIAVTTPMNEKLLATVTFKVVGEPTFTNAALSTL